MPTPVNRLPVVRQTIDLSPYPDLVVIYLGMRVNTLTGLKTIFGFGRQIDASVAAKPDGLLLHERIFFRSIRRTSACANTGATWTASWPSPAPNHIAPGGQNSSKIPAAPASGTKPTASVAVWKPSTTTSQNQSGFLRFASAADARGSRFSALQRVGRGEPAKPADQVVPESDLYHD